MSTHLSPSSLIFVHNLSGFELKHLLLWNISKLCVSPLIFLIPHSCQGEMPAFLRLNCWQHFEQTRIPWNLSKNITVSSSSKQLKGTCPSQILKPNMERGKDDLIRAWCELGGKMWPKPANFLVFISFAFCQTDPIWHVFRNWKGNNAKYLILISCNQVDAKSYLVRLFRFCGSNQTNQWLLSAPRGNIRWEGGGGEDEVGGRERERDGKE